MMSKAMPKQHENQGSKVRISLMNIEVHPAHSNDKYALNDWFSQFSARHWQQQRQTVPAQRKSLRPLAAYSRSSESYSRCVCVRPQRRREN